MEELEKKFQELKLELAAYKRDRYWLAVVATIIFAFLGITSAWVIPRDIRKIAAEEALNQVKEQMPVAVRGEVERQIPDAVRKEIEVSVDRTQILEELVKIQNQALTSAAAIEEEKARASNAGKEISNLLKQLSDSVDDWKDLEPMHWKVYGGGHPNPSYFQDKLGFVHLRGLLTPNADFGKDGFIFKLPKPQSDLQIPVACSVKNVLETCQIWVRIDGTVDMRSVTEDWISLDGVTFLAAPKQN